MYEFVIDVRKVHLLNNVCFFRKKMFRYCFISKKELSLCAFNFIMGRSVEESIRIFESKFNDLERELNRLRKENCELKKELQEEQSQLQNAHAEIEKLKRSNHELHDNYNRLKLAKAFGMSEDSKKQAYLRLTRMVCEIDACINLLKK